ncbi:hypothetical protein KUTeg_004600 [Tegillarca granosa]|uniref:Hexosyltransferase n=1 Tax=Tegillarca granosa TaxID=220873 RepID=A0ABQ9FQG7_TEGGR|nr:hypothetical protein KUTeg_004600 [Tegillarca granosa]
MGQAICNNSSPFLIILIPSIPNNKEVRNAIRTTWGSIAKGGVWPRKSVNVKIKLAFLLGMSDPENLTLTKLINEESTTYGDLIEGNFTDSYYNLTLKILLGLKWYIGPEGKILGCISLHSPVLRSGKWKLDKSLYPFPRYPKYVSGCSYFISINVVPRLFQISEYFPYISIEDAFITGMLAKSVNTAVAALPGVTYWGEKLARSCDFVLDKKISGLVNIKRLHAIWKKMNSENLKMLTS